jgi:hypothetical protein
MITALAVAIFTLAGCSDDDHDMLSNNDTGIVSIAAAYPADGSTNVSTATVFALKYTGPVDTMSVMQNFRLAGGQSMHEWIDSLEHHGGFGMMNMNMEQQMMNWMDSIQITGEFHWNGILDSCEFMPDSTLMSSTDYLCLLFEGGMRDSHGGMMGGASHNDDGYHMYSFTTGPKSTTLSN